MKKGILVVSFGTTYRDTRVKTIEAVERMVQAAYPDIPCCRAYSSGIVRRKLMEKEGLSVMDVHEALTQMNREGITDVYILPTYVIHGIESRRLEEEARHWSEVFARVRIGTPLLADEADYENTAKALYLEYKQEQEMKSLVLIGHGTSHEAHDSYERLERTFHRLGYEDVYVATVEGEGDMEALLHRMERNKKSGGHVILAPLMLVAGDHANHDMAGDGASYQNLLNHAGYHVQPVMKGLGELKGIRDIYLSHLRVQMKY